MPLRLSGDGKIEINELLIGNSSSVSLPANTSIGNVDHSEISHLDNVTSSIQSQLNLKSNIASPTFTGNVSASNVVVSNDLTVDTDTFFVDSTNNRVGIGTTSTKQALDVNGGIYTRSQSGGFTWGGDIDGAKWSSKLGGFNLTFGNDGTSGTALESWTIDGRTYRGYVRFTNSGAIVANNQPAIKLNGNASWFLPTTETPLTQFSVLFSRGGMSWNSSNGRITVPVAGYYMFNFTAYLDTANGGRFFLSKNGSLVQLLHSASHDGTLEIGVLQDMAANDYFSVTPSSFDYANSFLGGAHAQMYCYFLG